MKKLLSLLLCVMLCTSLALPAAAREPAVAPVPFDAYQTAYIAAYNALFSDIALSWISDVIDGEETWAALMDNTLPLVMLTVKEGVVTDVSVLYDAPATDDELFYFTLMCAMAGTALQPGNDADMTAALRTAVDNVYATLSACLDAGQPTGTLWGYPCYFEFEPQEDGNCHFLLLLDLSGEVLP